MFTFGISVTLSQTKVNNVNVVLSTLSPTYKKVIRLNVSMNNAFLVDLLDALN